MLNSLVLDKNTKVTNWILTGVSPVKPFDVGFALTMTNLTNGRVNLKFNNSVLGQKKNSPSLYSNFILNFYIVYELNNWWRNPTNNFTPKDRLFGTVKLTRNADQSKFTYNGRGIAFDGKGMWSYVNYFARNIVIFGVVNTSSSHTNNKKINSLVFSEGPTESYY